MKLTSTTLLAFVGAALAANPPPPMRTNHHIQGYQELHAASTTSTATEDERAEPTSIADLSLPEDMDEAKYAAIDMISKIVNEEKWEEEKHDGRKQRRGDGPVGFCCLLRYVVPPWSEKCAHRIC